MSKREERKAAKAEAAALQERAEAAAEAARYRAVLEDQLDDAKNFDGVDPSEVDGCPLQTKANERLFMSYENALLIEPRRSGGDWEGASQGVSVRVPGTKSMRYRVGANRGHYVQGEDKPTPIDQGTLVITNQRAVFIGAKQTREWSWTKLIGFTHSAEAPWTAIAVSNRQKTSGVLYDPEHEDKVRFVLDIAVARSTGTIDALVQQLRDELDALGPPSTTPELAAAHALVAMSAPAAWLTDPTARHALRYWDGSVWTEHVSDSGVQASDPIT